MYIAHSALQPELQQLTTRQTLITDNELQLRYQAYQAICSKYHREIAAIQQYMPDWRPSPPTP